MKFIRKNFTPTQVIVLSFALTIIIGALLLRLPVSSASGNAISFIDCLFTATTSVCVTGLTTVTTATTWSLFGKVVILVLIQLGGLGIVAISTGLIMIIGKRIDLHGRILLEDSFNLDTLSGLVSFLRKVFMGTLSVELLGALCYSFVFVPRYGALRGIWYSIFHSISAFCNAGIDLLGDTSLQIFVTHPWINIVTMFLIIMGGLGFIVWWDIYEIIKQRILKKIPKHQCYKRLKLHSRIVINMTAFLIISGAILIFIFEFTNDKTLAPLNLFEKIQAALFQSVTTRTAGFFTIPQENFREATALICIVMMMIGGSPIGTAGGIKTTTFAMLYYCLKSTVTGEESIIAHGRKIPQRTVQKAISIIIVSFIFIGLATLALSIIMPCSLVSLMYEAVSALATVGLTRGITGLLPLIGKVVIILCMYIGRIGPLSLILFFNSKKKRGLIKYPEEDITVG